MPARQLLESGLGLSLLVSARTDNTLLSNSPTPLVSLLFELGAV